MQKLAREQGSTALHLHEMMKCEQGSRGGRGGKGGKGGKGAGEQGRQGRQGSKGGRGGRGAGEAREQGRQGKKVFLILKFISSNEISSPNYAMPTAQCC